MIINDGRLPYFPCYPAKLLGAIAGMPPDQALVYMVVLLRIYEVRGPCPDGVEVLARRVGISKRRVADALDPLFRSEKLMRVTTGIMNPFADRILEGTAALRERLARAGARGGLRTAEKKAAKTIKPAKPGSSPAQASPQQLELESELSPDGDSTPAAAKPPWPSDYRERFWKLYPRRTEKKAALEKLDAIKRGGRVEWSVLIAAVQRYASHTAGTESRFIKHPATWLNRGCWDDEITAEPPPPPPKNRRENGWASLLQDGMMEEVDGITDPRGATVIDADPIPHRSH